MTCLSGDALPKITYVAYKIPDAGSEILRNPSESLEDIFSRAEILHEEIGKHNSMRRKVLRLVKFFQLRNMNNVTKILCDRIRAADWSV